MSTAACFIEASTSACSGPQSGSAPVLPCPHVTRVIISAMNPASLSSNASPHYFHPALFIVSAGEGSSARNKMEFNNVPTF